MCVIHSGIESHLLALAAILARASLADKASPRIMSAPHRFVAVTSHNSMSNSKLLLLGLHLASNINRHGIMLNPSWMIMK